MDKVIVAALLIIGAVTAAAVGMIAIEASTTSSSQSVAESQLEDAVRTRTEIEVISVSVLAGDTKVHAWVKNVGTVPILAIGW